MTQTPGSSRAESAGLGVRPEADPATDPSAQPDVVPGIPNGSGISNGTGIPNGSGIPNGRAEQVGRRPAGGAEVDPRLRLSRGVLLSGRYLLTRRLEHTSSNEVWQAVDQTLVRDVRIIAIQASDARADRILEAARRAALVRDQHFLRVYDADRATVSDLTRVWRSAAPDSLDGPPSGTAREAPEQAPGLAAPLVYVVEEWVSAQSLQTLLRRSPLPATQAVVLTLELAEALAAAHAQGMPHGFVSPDRVLVAANGSVRVSGLRSAAVLTARPPAPTGSPAAAEQDAADAAADVRSVGAVLYAALTARWPLGGDADSPTESLWRWSPGAVVHADDDQPGQPALRAAPRAHGRVLAPRQVRPGVPRRLDELVMRLLGQPVGDHPPVRTPGEAVELLTAHLQPTADRGGALPALRDLADPQVPGSRPAGPPPRPEPPRPAPPRPVPARTAVPAGTAAPAGGALPAGNAVPAGNLPAGGALPAGTAEPAGATAAAARSAEPLRRLSRADPLAPARSLAPDGPAGRRPGTVPDVPAAPVALADDDDRPAFLAWQGTEARIADEGPGDGEGGPVGRVPGDRRAPDLRLNPSEPPSNRFRPLLIGLVVVALLGAGTTLVVFSKKTLSGRGSNPQPLRPSATAPVSAGASARPSGTGGALLAGPVVTLPIVGARDFDPTATGGNGTENPGLVGLATDGNNTTAWTTVTYFGRANLGGLKPGVGLVFDLGTVRQVRRVVVGLTGQGTSVQFLASSAGSQPQVVADFTKVAEVSGAGAQAVLVPRSPVRVRWVLVWLTRLPEIGPGQYQGGISSVIIRGQTGP